MACIAVCWACGSDPSDPEPTCAFLPESLDFPVTAAGDTARQTVKLMSLTWRDQTVRLRVSSPEFSVAGPDTGAELELDGRRTVEVDVRFHPMSAGPKSAQVVVEGARCDPLVCEAAAEWDACVVEPLRLEFGRVEMGEEKTLSFTIHCTGPDSASGRVGAACSEYTIAGEGGVFGLAPGESLQVEVTYRPRTRGEAGCTITLGEGWCEPVECVGTSSKTWRVRVDGTGDAPTVQAGIDSSGRGDIVLVGPGTYYENIDLKGRQIHLKGEMGAEATVLDGSRGDNSVVMSNPVEYISITIEGFTITGGAGQPGHSRLGGGVYSANTGLTLRSCTVRDNQMDCAPWCYSAGAGVYAKNPLSAPPVVIEKCLIEGNYSSGNAGGLFLTGTCVVQDNQLLRNRTGQGDGGGAYINPAGGSVLLHSNLFWQNTANDHGGGIYVANTGTPASMVEVTGNLIIGNSAMGGDGAVDGSGGGCWMYGHGCIFHHNTVAFNRAERVLGDFAPTGGVALLNPKPDLRIEYNLVYANEDGGVTAYGLGGGGEHWSATLVRNLIFANGPQDTATGIFLPGEEIALILQETVFANPLFCVIGPDSRGELAYGSPALAQPFGAIGAVDRGSCDSPASIKPGRIPWEDIKETHAP